MLFTTKTEYGLRALVKLAKNSTGRPLSLLQIAREEKLPKLYLEQLFKNLKAERIVKSSKGAEGGYALFKPAEKISLLRIIEALEGPLLVSYCLSDKGQTRCSCQSCLTKKVWNKLQKNIKATLQAFTLKDLI